MKFFFNTVDCLNCDGSNVGQSSQYLNARLKNRAKDEIKGKTHEDILIKAKDEE